MKKTSTCHFVSATICSLLFCLLSSFAVAQSEIFPDDSIKPDPALSPDETNPPPVRSLDYTKPDPALSPD